MNKQECMDDHNVEVWIQENGWPTENSDTIEMMCLYREWWELYPRSRITGIPNGDYLIEMITNRIRHLHPESEKDAIIITTLLIIKAAHMAFNEGIRPPITH